MEDLTPQELILKTELNKQDIIIMCQNTFNYTCFEDSIHLQYFDLFSTYIYNTIKARFIKELITNQDFVNYDTYINTETSTALSIYSGMTCLDWQDFIAHLQIQLTQLQLMMVAQ